MIRLAEPDIEADAIEAVCRVLRTGMLVQGEEVRRFEERLATEIGAPHVTVVSSGTAALHLSLVALGIGRDDAVFVPAFTFPATANVVELVGARPVLVDVDPETCCMTPPGLEQAVRAWAGPEVPRAVLPVHAFGAPCRMEALMDVARREGLWVVEDAACALGTRLSGRHVGTFGELGCFSLHPRKTITTGEGGVIVAADPDLHRRLALLRNHGLERGPDGNTDFILPGFNYRLTDFQAALGASQLDGLPATLRRRDRLAGIYHERLAGVKALRLPPRVPGHAWQTFMVVLPQNMDRPRLIASLRHRGIETNLGAQALHRLRFYREKYGYAAADYCVASELFERGLALPLHGGLTASEVSHVADSLRTELAR